MATLALLGVLAVFVAACVALVVRGIRANRDDEGLDRGAVLELDPGEDKTLAASRAEIVDFAQWSERLR